MISMHKKETTMHANGGSSEVEMDLVMQVIGVPLPPLDMVLPCHLRLASSIICPSPLKKID
jgi:hypothetical protein